MRPTPPGGWRAHRLDGTAPATLVMLSGGVDSTAALFLELTRPIAALSKRETLALLPRRAGPT